MNKIIYNSKKVKASDRNHLKPQFLRLLRRGKVPYKL